MNYNNNGNGPPPGGYNGGNQPGPHGGYSAGAPQGPQPGGQQQGGSQPQWGQQGQPQQGQYGGQQGGQPGYGPPNGGYGAPQQYGMAQYNPYAAQLPGVGVQMGFGAPMAPLPPVDTGAMALKWWMVGCLGGSVVFAVLGSILAAVLGDSDAGALAMIPFLLSGGAFLAIFVLHHVWLYKSWAMIPEPFRMTEGGTRVSPGTALGYLFIPIFTLYWRFVAYGGLCDALNYVLTAYGSPKRAPKGLAIACCVALFVPYIGWAAAPIMFIIYTMMVDSAKEEYLRIASSQNPQVPGMPAY